MAQKKSTKADYADRFTMNAKSMANIRTIPAKKSAPKASKKK